MYSTSGLLFGVFIRTRLHFLLSLFLADYTNGEENAELSRLLLDPDRSQNLRLPNIFSFLPYLLNNPLSTVPAFVLGQGKTYGLFFYSYFTLNRFSRFIDLFLQRRLFSVCRQ